MKSDDWNSKWKFYEKMSCQRFNVQNETHTFNEADGGLCITSGIEYHLTVNTFNLMRKKHTWRTYKNNLDSYHLLCSLYALSTSSALESSLLKIYFLKKCSKKWNGKIHRVFHVDFIRNWLTVFLQLTYSEVIDKKCLDMRALPHSPSIMSKLVLEILDNCC